MANRVLNLTTIGSTAVLALIVVFRSVAGGIDPRTHFINLDRGCRLSIDAGGADAEHGTGTRALKN